MVRSSSGSMGNEGFCHRLGSIRAGLCGGKTHGKAKTDGNGWGDEVFPGL